MGQHPEFRGRVVVVTGGAGGIGSGIIDAVNAEGATTVALDVNRNTAANLSLDCDLTDEAAVRESIRRVEKDAGAIDYVVCAAGIVRESPFEELESPQWHSVIDVSLTSSYLTLRAAIPGMSTRGRGAIVTMSSGWGRKGYPFGADYAAAKSGMEALTKSVALEFATRGVRANSVAPGPIRTAMIRDNPAFDETAKAAAIPMGRVGEVAEVVPAVLFLLSDGARYITGQVLHVNGGLLMP